MDLNAITSLLMVTLVTGMVVSTVAFAYCVRQELRKTKVRASTSVASDRDAA
jgi:hypothetical protein